MRICIATTDIIGPVRNGGVGTASAGLAEALALSNHSVHIHYCSSLYEQHSLEYVRHYYWNKRIGFSDLSHLDAKELRLFFQSAFGEVSVPVINSYLAYLQLRDKHYDVIHFPDFVGLGFFCTMAKATGTDFSKTVLVVNAHGPTMWSAMNNDTPLDNPNLLFRDALERGMLANADVLTTPSVYMQEWLANSGYKLPSEKLCIPNLLPASHRLREQSGPTDGRLPVNELVFFGRVETRKGIWTFLDAIEELGEAGLLEGKRVSFVGKCPDGGQGVSKELLGTRSRHWTFDWSLDDTLEAAEALKYIAQPGRLAVMPSFVENSPCVIAEALANRIPFISTDVGGIPELIHPDDRAEVLVKPNSRALIDRLKRAMAEGVSLARPSQGADDVCRMWMDFHDRVCTGLISSSAPNGGGTPKKKVSVCIVHKDRPEYLDQAIWSIRSQTYRPIEVIVADNHSSRAESIDFLDRLEAEGADLELKVVRRHQTPYPSQARNDAVKASSGEYIVFLDDDNLLKFDAVSTYVKAIEAGRFDLVVSCLDFFAGKIPPSNEGQFTKRFIFLGSAGVCGLFQNTLGDTNLILRRETFDRLGGFADLGFFAPAEDWRFLGEAKRKGLEIGVLPEPVVWYRQDAHVWRKSWRKRNQNGARRQSFEAQIGDCTLDAQILICFSQGLFHLVEDLQRKVATLRAQTEQSLGS